MVVKEKGHAKLKIENSLKANLYIAFRLFEVFINQ